MSEQDRANAIRKEILFQAFTVRPIALAAERIQRDARHAGYDYTLTEIKRELQFHCDNGLMFEIPDLGGSAHLYRIHAKGVTYYEQNYAA